MDKTVHIPVLLHDIIDILTLQPDDTVVDGTFGGGGHAQALLDLLGPNGRYVAIDADETALERGKERFAGDARITFVNGNFRELARHIETLDIAHVDKVLLDLGLSSDQLERASGRGFSFTRDEPLLMTLAAQPAQGAITAREIVNEWSEESIANILYGYGEERRARRIARAIVEERTETPIETTTALAALVERVVPRRGKRHPATRTFQALRIAVNDEFGALRDALDGARSVLGTGGRLAVITFHSLEDRIVKQTLRNWAQEGEGIVLTKKPIVPGDDEVEHNPRARSAKLRAFERT